MAWVITDETSHLKLVNGVKKYLLPKGDIKVILENGIVVIEGDSGNVRDNIVIDYQNVTTPSESSGADLFDTIVGYMTSGGGGDASSANQDTMITHLSEVEGAVETLEADLAIPSAIADGEKDVAVTGTAVALGTTAAMKFVVLTAKSGNGATIWVGGSSVTDDGDTGNPLAAGESMTVYLADIADVYINGTATDGVTFSRFN